MNQNPVLKLIKQHRSIRKFIQQPVDQTLLRELVVAGQCASSSSFVQATSVIQVIQSETRKALSKAAGSQPYVNTAAEFLVFCADMNRNQAICAEQQIDMPTGYTEQLLIATVDTALFAQNVLLAAEAHGLGGVYIGGLRNQPATVSQLLHLPQQVYAVFGLCLGYPAQDPAVKPRLPLSLVLHQDRYKPLDTAALTDYDHQLADYYHQRSGGKLQQNFSENTVNTMKQEARPHMWDYLQRCGFMTR
jgi:nitroreductase